MIVYNGYRQSRLGLVTYYTPWPMSAPRPTQEAFILREGPLPMFQQDDEMPKLPERPNPALGSAFPTAELVVAGVVAILAATLA